MAQALSMTLVFTGISYPLISHLSLHSLESNKGAGGCSLKVSLTTAFMNFNSWMPDSSTVPFPVNSRLTLVPFPSLRGVLSVQSLPTLQLLMKSRLNHWTCPERGLMSLIIPPLMVSLENQFLLFNCTWSKSIPDFHYDQKYFYFIA